MIKPATEIVTIEKDGIKIHIQLRDSVLGSTKITVEANGKTLETEISDPIFYKGKDAFVSVDQYNHVSRTMRTVGKHSMFHSVTHPTLGIPHTIKNDLFIFEDQ